MKNIEKLDLNLINTGLPNIQASLNCFLRFFEKLWMTQIMTNNVLELKQLLFTRNRVFYLTLFNVTKPDFKYN